MFCNSKYLEKIVKHKFCEKSVNIYIALYELHIYPLLPH